MTETVVETPEIVDQEVVTTETETPEVQTSEGAAPETQDPAATPQVTVTEAEKPDYMTRSDWEREKGEVASRAAADALESDRRRRQTENARRAKQETEQTAARQEAIDTLKASLGAKGIYDLPDDDALTAINRIASKQAERMANASLDTVDEAWDYLTAPAYGKQAELDDSFELAAKRLGPKVQHLIDTIRPVIEKEARKGYIAESDLPKRLEAEIARRNAKGREGQEELKHVPGQPNTVDRSPAEVNKRISKGTYDEEDQRIAQENIRRIRSK